MRFRYRQSNVRRLLPAFDCCRARGDQNNRCAEFRQRTEFGSSRKMGGPAEQLLDGSEKRICRLSF